MAHIISDALHYIPFFERSKWYAMTTARIAPEQFAAEFTPLAETGREMTGSSGDRSWIHLPLFWKKYC
jgi:hypothetical protein